jgi:S1-C subfamily serine protease
MHNDRREYRAKVIGMDKPSDIAVLKIDAKNLPTVKLDRANDVKVGQRVVAIAAPFGFENSATAGIVSAKSRTLPGGHLRAVPANRCCRESGQFRRPAVQREGRRPDPSPAT